MPAVSQDHYITRPLPFGGKYAVVLWRHPNVNVSQPFLVDEAHPVVDADMKRQAGITFQGKVIDETGRPAALQELILIYNTGYKTGGFGGGGITTRRDGTFSIPNVNLDVPGYYEIRLQDEKTWGRDTFRFDGNTPQPFVITCRKKADSSR